MSDELVRQATAPIEEWCKQSLARIDALEAENAELYEACAKWAEASQGNYQRAKSAEAELDGLRAALEKADDLADGLDSLMNEAEVYERFNLDEDTAALAAYRAAREAVK